MSSTIKPKSKRRASTRDGRIIIRKEYKWNIWQKKNPAKRRMLIQIMLQAYARRGEAVAPAGYEGNALRKLR